MAKPPFGVTPLRRKVVGRLAFLCRRIVVGTPIFAYRILQNGRPQIIAGVVVKTDIAVLGTRICIGVAR